MKKYFYIPIYLELNNLILKYNFEYQNEIWDYPYFRQEYWKFYFSRFLEKFDPESINYIEYQTCKTFDEYFRDENMKLTDALVATRTDLQRLSYRKENHSCGIIPEYHFNPEGPEALTVLIGQFENEERVLQSQMLQIEISVFAYGMQNAEPFDRKLLAGLYKYYFRHVDKLKTIFSDIAAFRRLVMQVYKKEIQFQELHQIFQEAGQIEKRIIGEAGLFFREAKEFHYLMDSELKSVEDYLGSTFTYFTGSRVENENIEKMLAALDHIRIMFLNMEAGIKRAILQKQLDIDECDRLRVSDDNNPINKNE